MAKKIVELKSKRKVELKEMSLDDIDFCNDSTLLKTDADGNPYIVGMSKSRTAWLRRGIKGGDFKSFKIENGFACDSALKELTEDEKNELIPLIQAHQQLGE
ncbi:MAG: hypothetical protein Unbinned2990contig1002_7 [Prokaryotic dsDNA virus sp.]|nr:MAG: hypothetical protein Unbinned2990contig1002_7 [Prokaryotic dsDNA virus sp.]|tara:strand:- start:9643 stop:9948 length:306 start_codon:yes stop_codon:yes gene_type:complete